MKAKRKRRRGWILILLLPLLLIGALVFVISWKLPSVSALQNYRPPVASEIFSDDFVKIGEFARERRIYVPYSQIPPLLAKAFVAAEDDQFFRHRGFSATGILRAMLKNLVAGEVKQGGSTITQQVAKAILLTPERSIMRKIREVILAHKMEQFLSKERILEIYLNQVYLGHGAYGVQAAAQTYFEKDVADLALGEIAVLAGLPRAPSRDNPFTDMARAKEKEHYVLKRMAEENYITVEESQNAEGVPLRLASEEELNLRYSPYFVEHIRRYVTERYGNDAVLEGGLQIYTTLDASSAKKAQQSVREGIEDLDRHQGYRGAIEQVPVANRPAMLAKLKEEIGEDSLVATKRYHAMVTEVRDGDGLVYVSLGSRSAIITIDDMSWARTPNPERFWENDLIDKPSKALKVGDVIWIRTLREPKPESRKVPANVMLVSLAQEPKVQGALTALDPRNGAIRQMVGGYDFEKSEFNRVVQAKRQPGSAFKALIYAAALDKGYTAASLLIDAPMTYDDPTTDLTWRPKNYEGKFRGPTIFRECLIESLNLPTIRMVQDIGIDAVIEAARRFGITAPLARDFSLALGSSALTPMELVSAYTVFASGGKRFAPVAVRKVVDRDGHVLERNLLDDPGLDLTEQAAVAHSQLTSRVNDHAAIESGKNPSAPLPNGYALSPQTTYIMTHLLKQVIRSGTGRRAAAINRPAAGKTGTTNDNYDVWFIGYTPNLVSGVWLGLDEAATLGPREAGGHAATPVWLEFMKEATKNMPAVDFPVPDGVIFAQIDPKTGTLATPKTKDPVFEAFREGTAPKETTDEVKKKKTPQDFFLQE